LYKQRVTLTTNYSSLLDKIYCLLEIKSQYLARGLHINVETSVNDYKRYHTSKCRQNKKR